MFSYAELYAPSVSYLLGYTRIDGFSFDVHLDLFIGLIVQGRELHWLLMLSTQ